MTEENKQELKPCRVCKKQMDMNNKNAYITGMAGSMHFYVCSSGCLSEYYIPKNNTRADSKPEADILTTALDVPTAQHDDVLAEVERLKARIHQMQNEEIDSMHDIVAEHDGAVAEVESLTALLQKEASAHARTLGKAEKYKRLLEVAIDKIEASEKYNKEKK